MLVDIGHKDVVVEVHDEVANIYLMYTGHRPNIHDEAGTNDMRERTGLHEEVETKV